MRPKAIAVTAAIRGGASFRARKANIKHAKTIAVRTTPRTWGLNEETLVQPDDLFESASMHNREFMLKVVMARGLRLVEYAFHAQPDWTRRNMPLEFIAHLM